MPTPYAPVVLSREAGHQTSKRYLLSPLPRIIRLKKLGRSIHQTMPPRLKDRFNGASIQLGGDPVCVLGNGSLNLKMMAV